MCIKNCFVNYQNDGINDKKLIEKNKKISNLFKKLKITDENEKNKVEENEKKDSMGLFSKIINYGKEVIKKQEQNYEKLTLKDIEDAQTELNNLLTEHCALCSEYLVENIQNSLIDEKKDYNEWAYV